MKYAKFISKTKIEYPPLNKGNILNYNICESELLKDGYKPLQEGIMPDNEELTVTYEETEDKIIQHIVLPSEEELREKENQRIQGLKCTKRVFVLILQQLGISYTSLKAKIAENEQAQTEWDLCVELERSNPFINIIAEQMGFDSEKVDKIFQIANGETVEIEKETPTPTEEAEEIPTPTEEQNEIIEETPIPTEEQTETVEEMPTPTEQQEEQTEQEEETEQETEEETEETQTGEEENIEEETEPEEENTEDEPETVIDKGEIFDEYFGDDSENDDISENNTDTEET